MLTFMRQFRRKRVLIMDKVFNPPIKLKVLKAVILAKAKAKRERATALKRATAMQGNRNPFAQNSIRRPLHDTKKTLS